MFDASGADPGSDELDPPDELLRARLYGNLSALFGPLPAALDAEPPGRFPRHPRTRAALRELADDFARAERQTLAVEQVRLFVNAPGGVPAPPYASHYLDGTLMGPACVWVAREYARQALEHDPSSGQPADFAGCEFEYLELLCRHQIAALATGDEPAHAAAAAAEARFFSRHLARWLPRFARDLRTAAGGGFYRRMAELMTTFCEEEQARLRPPKA